MYQPFHFWSWLIGLPALLLVPIRYLAGGEGPFSPDEWTPIPPVSPRNVEFYAYQGCTDREIADRFLVDEESIRRDFSPVLRATRGLRAMRLRQAQFKLACDPNGPMLNWLGRNELGQSNNPAAPGSPEPELPL